MRKTDVRSQTSEVSRNASGCVLPVSPTVLVVGVFSSLNLNSNLRLLISVSCALLFAFGSSVAGQQQTKTARIGSLHFGSRSANAARIEAFREGLRELGYVEGKNIVIEWRFAEGKIDRLPPLASELVRLNVNAIVTSGATVTHAVKDATLTIPIIMAFGLAALTPELSGKRLELLKEIVPKLSRIAILGTSTTPGNAQALKEMEPAAGAFGMKLQYLDILDSKDLETIFRHVSKGRPDAVLLLQSLILNSARKRVVDLTIKSRLPAMFYNPEWVQDGGLVSYGVSFTDLYRRAATYVDKILKGTEPADLPVAQPTKFELVINLKTAKRIGVTIPPNVLAKADRVIR